MSYLINNELSELSNDFVSAFEVTLGSDCELSDDFVEVYLKLLCVQIITQCFLNIFKNHIQ